MSLRTNNSFVNAILLTYTEKIENVYTRQLIREIYDRIRHGNVEPQSEYFLCCGYSFAHPYIKTTELSVLENTSINKSLFKLVICHFIASNTKLDVTTSIVFPLLSATGDPEKSDCICLLLSLR